MKNREVIVFFVMVLFLTTPIVYADTFLSGYSVLDSVKSFFGSAVNFFKEIFSKEKVGGDILKTSPSDEGATEVPVPEEGGFEDFETSPADEGATEVPEEEPDIIIPTPNEPDTPDVVQPPLEYCGDGTINGDEECEGNNFGEKSRNCVDYFEGFVSGELKCENCRINTKNCIQRVCFSGRKICEGNNQYKVCNTQGTGYDAPISCEPGKECISGQCVQKVEICDDNQDNDNDGLTDNLDLDCNGQPGLKIKSIQSSKKEVFAPSKISVDCYYEITPSRTPQEVSQCMSLTLNNENMQCQRSIQQNFIRFSECDVGNEGVNKIISCSVLNNCNFVEDFKSNMTYINVTEFTICEFGQASPDLIRTLDIIEPDENEEFEAGDEIDIEAKASNNFGDDAEFSVRASLVDIEAWEEVEVSDEETKDIDNSEDETFELNLTIPDDLEDGNYKLYVKAYKEDDEDELCMSKGIALQIQGIDESCIDEDEDNFCEDDDCNDNNPRVHPGAVESCSDAIDNDCDGFTDFADSSCQTIPGEGKPGDLGNEFGDEKEDLTDSDNDGLPDYWEYNFFGNLLQGPNEDPDNDGIINVDEYIGNTNPKISNKKSSLLMIILIIIGIIVIAAIFFIVKKIKNKPRRAAAINYGMDQSNQSKLQQFIQQAKSQGMSRQQIKNSLLNAGWKENDINKFL